MGRKLSYYERSQRDRERENEREKKADAVAQRRADAKRVHWFDDGQFFHFY